MQAASAARPLRAWRDTQLAQVCAVFDRAASSWRHAWLRTSANARRALCVAAHEHEGAQDVSWFALGHKGAARAWMRGGPAFQSELLCELFGADAHDAPVARALAGRAQAALSNGLCRAAGLEAPKGAEGPDPELFGRWSGAVVVSCGDWPGIELLIDPACVEQLATAAQVVSPLPLPLPSPSPLAAVTDALAGRKLALKVELAAVELNFAALSGLRVGDVIPLPHPVDQPLHVTTAGLPVCAGWLGRRDDQRAVELARDPPPSSSSVELKPA